ncbi:hypothetical protein [Azomonas macrocytogenes]|uniref:Uncharacterized protein n=1 Tax=Azomonas macrocytogenes TaxID=69962 RepID=A0A839SYC7_AZOMA|nr:hypothetical protein [Azomonas macrocytogenes]MBB3102122.1 hypothetical protein [Azomonas macrocytogenes]
MSDLPDLGIDPGYNLPDHYFTAPDTEQVYCGIPSSASAADIRVQQNCKGATRPGSVTA